jgi:hypothetical protein
MKKILIIPGALLLAVLIAAGSFWGGMQYQSTRSAQAQANFFNARGGLPQGTGQFPGGGQFPGDGQPNGGQVPDGGLGFPGGRGTTGKVRAIDGNILTLSTPQDVTTVNVSGATQIQKSTSGTAADLEPGTRVMVTGETNSDGTVTANRITILDNNSSPAGAAP